MHSHNICILFLVKDNTRPFYQSREDDANCAAAPQ